MSELTTDRAGRRARPGVFVPIHTRRSFEDVIDQVSGAIRAGEISVGSRLPSERVLSARMAISRPTLREAMKILVDVGVIEVRVGSTGGMFVKSDIVPRALLEQRSRLRLSEVPAVLEARRALEPQIALVALVHAGAEDFAAMADIIAAHRSSNGDRVLTGEFDLRFHLAIARATKNPYLVSVTKQIQRELEIVREMAIMDPFDHDWSITIHEATLAALRSRDAVMLTEVMDDHLAYLERVWQAETGWRLARIPGGAPTGKPHHSRFAHPLVKKTDHFLGFNRGLHGGELGAS